MKNSTKVFMAMSIAVILVFASCSKKEQGAGGGTGGGSQTVTISVGGWPNMDRCWDANIEGFKAKYPNIKVEYAMAAWSPHHQSLQTALAAGTGAHDVDMIEAAFIAQYRDSTALEDLLKAPYNAGRLQNDFCSYKWNQAYSSDGSRLVAIPWDIGPMAFWYRADVFEEVGLPTDPVEVAKYMSEWSGFVDMARKVYIPGKRWLIPNAADCYNMLFRNRDYFDDSLNFVIDRPKDIDCLNAIITIRNNKWDLATGSDTEQNAAYTSGAVVAQMNGVWWETGLKLDLAADQSGLWRVTTLPGGHDSLNAGGSHLCIPSQGTHKEEAWKFVEYMLATSEAQNNMMKLGYFPAYKPAWNDSIYEQPDPFYGGQKSTAVFKSIALGLDHPIITTIMDFTADSLIGNTVNEGLTRGLSPQGIKDLLLSSVNTATAEAKRQQIDILKSVGKWN